MFGTILAVILTLLVVGGATGAAMYRVLDRSDSSGTSENGAVVEPIYESASPSPTDEPTEQQEPATQRQTGNQRTQEPTTIVVVPRHTASPTPFEHEEEPTPHDTPEQDEEFQTEEPTPDSFGDSSPGS